MLVEERLDAAPPDEVPASPSRRWQGPALTSVVAAGFALWGLALGLRPLGDNSFLTHLATGRFILDHGVPRVDPFSFTAGGEPWVVQSWLATAVYGLAEQWSGGHGVLLVVAALTALLGWLVWDLTAPAGTLLPRVAIAATVLGVAAGTWSERPLLVGLLGLALVLRASEGRLDPRWLVPVLWVWANSHGSFPLGLVALGALWTGRRLDGGPATTEARALRWAALGVLLAPIGPLGPKLLLFPVQLLGRSGVLRYVSEWQSPSFADVPQRLFIVLVVAAVAAAVRRPSWRRALALAVFLPLALLAARNIAVASLVLVPALAGGLDRLGTLDGRARSRVTAAGLVALAATAALLVVTALQRPAFDLGRYPERQVRWMASEGLLGADQRVVAPDTVGNYLHALRGTDANVFFDDRYDMYPQELTLDYMVLHRGEPAWSSVLERHGATAVLWKRSTPLGSLLVASPDWHVAAADADWVVAVPRSAGTVAG